MDLGSYKWYPLCSLLRNPIPCPDTFPAPMVEPFMEQMFCPVVISMQLPTVECNTVVGIMAAQLLVQLFDKFPHRKLMSEALDPVAYAFQCLIQFLTACFALQDWFSFLAFTHVMGKP